MFLNDFAAFGIHCQILTKAVSLCTVIKYTFTSEMIGRLGEGRMGSNVYVDEGKVLRRYFSPMKWQEHTNFHLEAKKENCFILLKIFLCKKPFPGTDLMGALILKPWTDGRVCPVDGRDGAIERCRGHSQILHSQGIRVKLKGKNQQRYVCGFSACPFHAFRKGLSSKSLSVT